MRYNKMDRQSRLGPGRKGILKQSGLPIIVGVIILLVTSLCFGALSGSLSEKEILLRIAPEGKVAIDHTGVVAENKPAVVMDIGQKRYEETCHVCHGPGLAGSPKLGDKEEWAPRIAEGMDTLMKHAIQGYKAMPPKGTCMSCSDEEIKKAIEYMISKSK